MAETVIVQPNEDPSALGTAATTAAALSGAAAATAQSADETAKSAQADATYAENLAREALNAPVGTSPEEVNRMVDEKLGTFKEEIVAAIRESAPPAAPVAVTEVSPSVQPPSVAKANKTQTKRRQTWGEKYLGLEPESDDE